MQALGQSRLSSLPRHLRIPAQGTKILLHPLGRTVYLHQNMSGSSAEADAGYGAGITAVRSAEIPGP